MRFEKLRMEVGRGLTVPLLLALGLALSVGPALAGTVSGTLTDSQGDPVPGAQVTIAGAGGTYLAESDGAGRFAAEDVAMGTYSVTILKSGFQRVDTSTEVGADGEVSLNLVMELAAVTEFMTVTAERREASILDVPIAVTALSGEDRDLLNIRNQNDLADIVPNMEFNAAPNRLTIRGIGRTDNALGSDPGVGTYVDSTYTSETAAISTHPLFLERTEVLRGPQGTLFGRNTVGGLVNMVTKRPDSAFNGEFRVMADDYERVDGVVTMSGPMTRNGPHYRLNLIYQDQNQGYLENLGSSGEIGVWSWFGGDAHLQHDFTDSFTMWLKYSGGLWKNRPGAWVRRAEYYALNQMNLSSTGAAGLSPNPMYGLSGNPAAAADSRQVLLDHDQFNRTDNINTLRGELIYSTGAVDIKYLGLWSEYDWDWLSDWDDTNRASYIDPVLGEIHTAQTNFIQEYKEWTTHELQFLSTTGGNVRWIGGLYYYKEDLWQPYSWRVDGAEGLENPNWAWWMVWDGDILTGPWFPWYQPVPAPLIPLEQLSGDGNIQNPDRNIYYQRGELNSEQYAAYGQVDFQPAEKWNIALGGRYSDDDKAGWEWNSWWSYNPIIPAYGNPSQVYVYGGPTIPANDPELDGRNLEGDWQGTTWRVAVDYKASVDSILYGSISTGFKSGGFRLGTLNDDARVDEETVYSYELGYKTRVLSNNSLRVGIAAFWNDYEDQQIPVWRRTVNEAGQDITVSEFFNIPDSETGGWEVELVWQPKLGSSLGINWGYLHSKIVSGLVFQDTDSPLPPPDNFVDVTGNSLQRSPENQLALYGGHTVNLGNGGYFTFSGHYAWVDEQHNSPFEEPWHTIGSYSTDSLRLKYGHPGDLFALVLQVRNITDDVYVTTVGNTDHNTGWATQEELGPPRVVSLEFQKRF